MPLTKFTTPSRDALRILRQLAFAGTISGVVLTEDRRRRISTASRIRENEKRLKASRNYHGAGAEAVKQLQEYGLTGPVEVEGEEGQGKIDLRWNIPLPDRPLLPGELDRLYQKERRFQKRERQQPSQPTQASKDPSISHPKIRQVPVNDDFVMPQPLNSIIFNHGPRIRHVKPLGPSSNPYRDQLMQTIYGSREPRNRKLDGLKGYHGQESQVIRKSKASSRSQSQSPRKSFEGEKVVRRVPSASSISRRTLHPASALRVLESKDPERGLQQRCAVNIDSLIRQSDAKPDAAVEAYLCAKTYLEGRPCPAEPELSYQLLSLVRVLQKGYKFAEANEIKAALALRESPEIIIELLQASRTYDAFGMFKRLYIENKLPNPSPRDMVAGRDLAIHLARLNHIPEAKVVIGALLSIGFDPVKTLRKIFATLKHEKHYIQLLEIYETFQDARIAENGSVFKWVIYAYMFTDRHQEAEEAIISGLQMQTEGLEGLLFHYINLMWMSKNDCDFVERVFTRFRAAYGERKPPVNLYDAIISVCALAERNEKALYYFNFMTNNEKIEPDFVSYSALAVASARKGDWVSVKNNLRLSMDKKSSNPKSLVEVSFFSDHLDEIFYSYGRAHYCPELINYIMETLDEIGCKPENYTISLAFQSCIHAENLPKLVEWLKYLHRDGVSLSPVNIRTIARSFQHVRHQRTELVTEFFKSLKSIGGEGFVSNEIMEPVENTAKYYVNRGSRNGKSNSDYTFEGRMYHKAPVMVLDIRKKMLAEAMEGRHEDVLRTFAKASKSHIKLDFSLFKIAMKSRNLCVSQDPNLPSTVLIEELAAKAGVNLNPPSSTKRFSFVDDQDVENNQELNKEILAAAEAVYNVDGPPDRKGRLYYRFLFDIVKLALLTECPRAAVDLLVAHLNSKMSQKVQFPLRGYVYLCHGYSMTRNVPGIIWVMQEIIKHDLDITRARIRDFRVWINSLGRLGQKDSLALDHALEDLEAMRQRHYERCQSWGKDIIAALQWFYDLPRVEQTRDKTRNIKKATMTKKLEAESSCARSIKHSNHTLSLPVPSVANSPSSNSSTAPPPPSQALSEAENLIAASEQLHSPREARRGMQPPRKVPSSKSRPPRDAWLTERPRKPFNPAPLQPSASKLVRKMTKSLDLPASSPLPATLSQ